MFRFNTRFDRQGCKTGLFNLVFWIWVWGLKVGFTRRLGAYGFKVRFCSQRRHGFFALSGAVLKKVLCAIRRGFYWYFFRFAAPSGAGFSRFNTRFYAPLGAGFSRF